MLIRSVEAQGADRTERQACVTHKAFSHNCHLCQLFAFCLGAPFSFTQKTALSSYILRYRALVFCVWKPCGCSTSDCAVLLRSRRTKRSGIMREMSLLCACRVCPPAERFRGFPQTKCRGGTEWGKHSEEGGKQNCCKMFHPCLR